MRIGLLCHKYPLDDQFGAIFVHELGRAISALGHEVHALVPASDSNRGVLTIDGVTVHRRLSPVKIMHQSSVDDSYASRPRLQMAAFMLRSVWQLYRLVERYQLDVIHAHWAIPMGLVATAARWLHRRPVVVTAHGRDLSLVALDGVTRPATWARPLSGFALRSADQVIFTTRDYAEVGRGYGVDDQKASIIPNGVDPQRFRLDQNRLELHHQLGLAPDDLMLLYVGLLDQKKGLFILLDALKGLVDTGIGVHLALVGDGPLKAALEERVRSLCLHKNVTMLGKIRHDNLPGVYAACDLYIQPSLVEPFGVVVLEAAACGKPIVASDVPGMRRVVTDDMGTLVPPGDHIALAEAIRTLLANPGLRAEMGRQGRRHVEANYSWRSVAQHTIALYEDVLERRRRRFNGAAREA